MSTRIVFAGGAEVTVDETSDDVLEKLRQDSPVQLHDSEQDVWVYREQIAYFCQSAESFVVSHATPGAD
jgi:hypothetical protein